MNKINIEINEESYIIKKSTRALMLFEELTNKSVMQLNESLTDIITLFYSILKANNTTFNFTLDEFTDVLDDNEYALNTFTEYLQSEASEGSQDKKKVTKKATKK